MSAVPSRGETASWDDAAVERAKKDREEMAKLETFFSSEEQSMGWEGDAERWSAPESAIELIRRLRKKIAALNALPPPPTTDWMPIESAPWEGPPVLLWKERTQEHYVAARVRGEHGPGWCTPDGFQIFGATHWLPLPPPPKASRT